MAITIHYQMPQGLFPIEEIPPSEVYQPMIDRAEGIARRVLDQLQIPHRLQRLDQRIPAPGSDDHYGLVYEMLGPAEGCEPLTCGWSYQSDHETRRSLPDGSWQRVMTWGSSCFVKADYARDPISDSHRGRHHHPHLASPGADRGIHRRGQLPAGPFLPQPDCSGKDAADGDQPSPCRAAPGAAVGQPTGVTGPGSRLQKPVF